VNRPPHPLARRHGWIFALLVMVLLAGHGVILYYLSARFMLSAAVVLVAILLLIITHRELYALLRRHRRGSGPVQNG
jgi:hypothetical protein